MRAGIKIKIAFLLLIMVSLAAGYTTVKHSYVTHELLPAQQSVYPWRTSPNADTDNGGNSVIDLRENTYNLSFDFRLLEGIQYPYITLGLTFDDDTQPEKLVDWSSYSAMRFRVKCRPANELSFVLHTYEDQITKLPDMTSFRPSMAFFSCTDEWHDVRVNLHRLDTPEWWLKQHNLNLSNKDYPLNQVRGFSIASSTQSPLDTQSSVSIEEITLYGQNWPLIYTVSVLGLVIWGGFLYWALPQLFRKENILPAPGVITPASYRQVTTEPKHERERSAVVDYLASEYVNPNLDVETIVSALGINRTKINDILREESGLTFTAYLNKLRLTEAARLLSEKQMAVSEAAFAVGFGSLSYFNRAFKKEFGCAPSSYKNPSASEPDSSSTP
ncbi:MAG TPA: AraC family transcriptional regulator [Cellvibrio sp.]|nr:AraC family transcriptional regulator [Cellvibrio sp.]